MTLARRWYTVLVVGLSIYHEGILEELSICNAAQIVPSQFRKGGKIDGRAERPTLALPLLWSALVYLRAEGSKARH